MRYAGAVVSSWSEFCVLIRADQSLLLMEHLTTWAHFWQFKWALQYLKQKIFKVLKLFMKLNRFTERICNLLNKKKTKQGILRIFFTSHR